MNDVFPITRGEPLKFAFGTSQQLGFQCPCPAHVTRDGSTVLISLDAEAIGALVLPIMKERPKGLPEKEAFAIAVEHVDGAIREVFQTFYEPLAEVGDAYGPERVGHFAMNEVAMHLLLLSMPDNVIYLKAWDDAVDAMRVEAELRSQQKETKPKRARKAKPAADGLGEAKSEGRVQ